MQIINPCDGFFYHFLTLMMGSYYLTQAVIYELFNGCIGIHTQGGQVTSLLYQSDIIM